MDYAEKVQNSCAIIVNAIKICDNCLDMLDINTDNFEENFKEQLREMLRIDDIGNSYSEAYMETTAILIEDKYPELKIVYDVSDLDTALYINKELYRVGDEKDKFLKGQNKDFKEMD